MKRRSPLDMCLVPRGAIATIAVSFLIVGLVFGVVLGAAFEVMR